MTPAEHQQTLDDDTTEAAWHQAELEDEQLQENDHEPE